jgi:hypothetical protein
MQAASGAVSAMSDTVKAATGAATSSAGESGAKQSAAGGALQCSMRHCCQSLAHGSLPVNAVHCAGSLCMCIVLCMWAISMLCQRFALGWGRVRHLVARWHCKPLLLLMQPMGVLKRCLCLTPLMRHQCLMTTLTLVNRWAP